jgi:hypothetical protein
MAQASPSGGPAGKDDRSAMAIAVVLYALSLALSGVLVLKGRYELGVGGTLLVLTLAPIGFAMARAAGLRRELRVRLREIESSLATLREQAMLSDDARRIVNRSAERDVLLRAIEEDITRENWDAAMILIKELADRFGFRAEAESLRGRVESARRQQREAEIGTAIAYLDGLILQRRWDDAAADASRIQRLYPDSPRVEPLRDRVAAARASYKQDLERRFTEAAGEERADEAMALLGELDQYLTPQEAEGLRQVARSVVTRARDGLGASFRAAVQERRWGDASRLADSILRQFPNTRMAEEVRGLMEGLRAKAAAGE